MNWLCRLFGHKRPVFDRNTVGPVSPQTGAQWFWEYSRCPRCGAETRELVASPRG